MPEKWNGTTEEYFAIVERDLAGVKSSLEHVAKLIEKDINLKEFL